ncbi:MAG: hypothetical protein IPM47_09520 [Sphingobacteriales bacterium]|nr:MAG: hypothetical protein IPM47_09520 [Sphingobacteriales bacterium]
MKRIINLLAIGLLFVLFLNSCGKDEDYLPTFNLRFTNTSSNPYLIEVDGNSNVIQGSTYKDYKLKIGTYAWEVTQQSGYILYPTVLSGTVNLDKDKQIVFP